MKNLRSCTAGAVAVLTAMTLPLLLGFTSLGVEVGHWYLVQRQMQGAADAAAISAAAQYIADYSSNPSSTAYQTVGQSYAATNGFTIPTANVCLITASGDNCNPVRTIDPRTIVCSTTPCIVVEITQNTLAWLTTLESLRPTSTIGHIVGVPTPVLKARAVVSTGRVTRTSAGTDCLLALANDAQAVLVHGNGDLRAACGVAVDGGLTQNPSGTAVGGIAFSGSNAFAHINTLIVAASSTGCPGTHCFLYNPSTTPLPGSAVLTNTATGDPYAATPFPTFPLGVQTGGVVRVAQGSGYTNGTRTFTVCGGTGIPAQFSATVAGGKVITIGSVIDPGAYTVFPLPTSGVFTATDTGSCPSSITASTATFTLTQGCFTWTNTPRPGRTYCSIHPSGTINFPTGSYYIAGGDNAGCGGFCMSGGGIHVTADAAGITFYLGNGYGANSRGTTVTANVNMSGFGSNSTLSLCAPGTGCGTGCTGSCLLFMQNPAAAASTSQGTPATTVNSFSGNGNSTISGLVYLPKQTFQTQGSTSIAGCFGVVAKYVDVGGTPTFTNGCLPGHGLGGGSVTVLINPFLTQ